MLRIANATNGLAFPPYDAVSMFLSSHGHSYKIGYFRIDAMPYNAVIALLRGESIVLVDATPSNKALPDAFRFGVTTWCIVFNRAIRQHVQVAPWQTREMWKAAHGEKHRKLVGRIRRLEKVFGNCGPAVIGKNVFFDVFRVFDKDDKPELIGGLAVGAH